MYQLPNDLRRAYEALPVPLAFYRYEEGRVLTVLVSDGLCRLMQSDRETLIGLLDNSMFERVHPDDAERIARIGDAFARHEGDYDVFYRSRYGEETRYTTIHTVGRWQTMPDGTELAVLVYVDISDSYDAFAQLSDHYELFQRDYFYNDPVTGLPNLNYVHEFADEKVHRLRQEDRDPALLYMDVKGLRSYNNQYGYSQGDELLQLIAEVLKAEFPDALICRGADDHYVVICAYESDEDLVRRIDRVNSSVKARAFGNTLGVQAGICVLEPSSTFTDAFDHARHALKQIGNDLNATHLFYAQETDEKYWNQRYIVEAFDTALQQNWIKIYYQAIMRTATHKAAALEALARWVDPVRGIISPAEFIPVLEKYHLLYKLDLYMVERFCREFPVRQKVGLPIIPVTVNFSAQDFDHADIVASLNEILDRYGVAHENLIIEITEQDIATATEHFKAQLRDIRRNGYRLWLDDFGSGYSSLNVLSQFDIDLVKFDLELLRNLDDHDGANRHIMRAITGVLHQLGIHTLAEGMETKAQLAFLQEIGVGFAQGFLFYKPESLDSICFKMAKGNPIVPCETAEERADFRRQWEAEVRANRSK